MTIEIALQAPDMVCLDISITNTGICALVGGKIMIASMSNKMFSNHGYLTRVAREAILKTFALTPMVTVGTIIGQKYYKCLASPANFIPISMCKNVFIEGAAYMKNNRSVMLNQFNGIVVAHMPNSDILEIAPKSHKKTFVGNGNATKQDTIDRVKELYEFDTKNDNIADALSLMYHVLTKKMCPAFFAEPEWFEKSKQ